MSNRDGLMVLAFFILTWGQAGLYTALLADHIKDTCGEVAP